MPRTPFEESHRPWPCPDRPWVMLMRWHDLLFMHWPIPAALLRPHIPAALEIDTFPGAGAREPAAWIGVIPFTMSNVRPRLVPPIPGVSAFHELNVRTYVHPRGEPGRPGVWFFSLDAASALAVAAARIFTGLPYHRARMSLVHDGERVLYASERTASGGEPGPGAAFRAAYAPTGPVYRSRAGGLDHWLTERYCLYSQRGRTLLRLEIHHDQWPLQPAAADVRVNTMTRPLGFDPPQAPPLLHFARRLDVVAWSPEVVATEPGASARVGRA